MQLAQRTNLHSGDHLPTHSSHTTPVSSTPLPSTRKRDNSSNKPKPRRDSEEIQFDEEKQKAHRYWVDWGTAKANEILKEDLEKNAPPLNEIVFSAQCGRRDHYRRHDDDDSEVTDLSMLACSDTSPATLTGRSTCSPDTNTSASTNTPVLPQLNRRSCNSLSDSADQATQGSTRKLRWNPTLVTTSPLTTPTSPPLNARTSLAYRITAKLATTLHSLQHVTGYGDNTDVVLATEQDVKRYTAEDFSHTARYPQEIRLSPSLSKLIAANVLSRMGRRKSRQITSKDVKRFEEAIQTSIRKDKKVCIHSWLRDLDVDFSPRIAPEIVELEPNIPRECCYPLRGTSRMIDLGSPVPSPTK